MLLKYHTQHDWGCYGDTNNKKRREYAQAHIPEYWIVNPQTELITVLHLENDRYVEHGVFKRGETATSALLEGFLVNVDAVLDAE